ncbi:MAG: hypothetical protein J07HQX50_00293 [Haloquadratum sp. J07HQX50]|nr:MAG: hypothetical protein J07HQX50_00293 [Haloquadratum sp. J07HQX50]
MISRENTVIIGFIVLATLLVVPLSESDPPVWAAPIVIIGVGVIAPILVNEYLNRNESS